MFSMLVSKLRWLSWPFCPWDDRSGKCCTSAAVVGGTGSGEVVCVIDSLGCAECLFVASIGFAEVVSNA